MHSFQGAPDGAFPESSLRSLPGGKGFVGTTTSGGLGTNRIASNQGTVFEIGPSGEENVVSTLGGGNGEFPKAGLTEGYGTTYKGGPGRHGTVFLLEPGGFARVVHAFTGEPDGAQPASNLIEMDRTLFGTTRTGGSNFQGTIFEVKKDGKERIVHSFTGAPSDGALPLASLVDVGGTLYGTTSKGGTYNEGTVFKLTSDGGESVIYSFKGTPDGAQPEGGLTKFRGGLYGTTTLGGVPGAIGTVFRVALDGTETIVHSFTGLEGIHPRAGLTAMNGSLYGTAASGGRGFGTLFALEPNGRVRVLHTFEGSDGAQPLAALVASHGTLYGTTRLGGRSGLGTVFSMKP